MTYLPKQKDIIWIDFDPQRGREIKKRRPAVILSSNLYTQNTGFVIVSPITSTIHDLPGYFSLNGYDIHGQVVAAQIYSFDARPKAGRNITYIETMRNVDFYRVAQTVYYNFDFPF
ncbi:type II toxin-antitoxin system PemK/MazF family toxin [Lactiplantibacillus pentosus]|uniref:Type II toxin-antitoxin system PemK/MazF family toxin n=3 Tax=Lactiplantibacillus pentosus TaxID=1589 RepID=A0AAX6LI71_LACPE|nr:type II toxin-antitoxin system PemK/MazF family toxin [Lactiplantibacillus pentosus]AYJ43143.1 type II toxin-antitoxin system PemK/MazF family toxin [Lactiplantibacillus pentosus]KRK25424.1 cell growth regulatory protein [Lactiplantibacillus pentosus DSM 20314]MBU7495678.1 type II toxin-antitoxin system PemK/MazF family toxin [Lactiplantibacillus pentosus]MCT3296909.1 type II toxin-antitoxin system PemK/MazF family toxin [Lactiplantibacillus pentosus]MCT3299518.1 type II toxin-antitoxin sys